MMTKPRTYWIMLLLAWLGFAPTAAQPWDEEAILPGMDESGTAGTSVAIAGNHALIGQAAEYNSKVLAFQRTGTSWSGPVELLPPVPFSDDEFGASIALDGNRALIGAPGDNTQGNRTGAAYIFEWNGSAWIQVAKLMATTGVDFERFGASVALDGDRALIGAPGRTSTCCDPRAAYIFERDTNGNWVQVARLTSSSGTSENGFGFSVALDGDRALIGAPHPDFSGIEAAYVFEWDGLAWTQTAMLTASAGPSFDEFGWSVALSGDRALVGAPFNDDNGSNAGAAYVFERNGASWNLVDQVLASNGAEDDRFGWSVALDGDRALIGAPASDFMFGETAIGSAYVFERGGTGLWIEVVILSPSGGDPGNTFDYADMFGYAVALDGDRALIGAPGHDECCDENSGAAYVFRANPITVAELAIDKVAAPLSPRVGDDIVFTVTLTNHGPDDATGVEVTDLLPDGFTFVSALLNQGTYHLDTGLWAVGTLANGGVATMEITATVNNPATWVNTAAITASDANDPDETNNQHSVTIIPTQSWIKTAQLLPSDGAPYDLFGNAVALDGDRALVGATGNDDRGLDAGAVYVLERDTNGNWSVVAKLTASDGTGGENFGESVALDGDRALIGAWRDDDLGGESGSAYVFERDTNGNWVQQAKLLPSDGVVAGHFGRSVSLQGDRALIGATGDDDNGPNAGAAYVFERDTNGNWVQQAKLLASDGDANDAFGRSVALDGDRALIGAIFDEENGGDNAGSAYVFERDTNGTWVQQAKLLASHGGSLYEFGASVALEGDRALIGARSENNVLGGAAGAAYIFERTGTTWNQTARLMAPDGTSGDVFGWSVALDGDRALIGAPGEDDRGSSAGAAYLFEWDGSGWELIAKVSAFDGAEGDEFGHAVALDGDRVLLGVWQDDDNGENAGSACVFEPEDGGIDPNDLPFWDGTIVNNGDGTGSIPLSVPLGLESVELVDYNNLVLKDILQGGSSLVGKRSGASLVAAGQFECTLSISDGCIRFDWNGPDADAPTAVDLIIAAPDSARSSFFLHITDTRGHTLRVDPVLDLYQGAVGTATQEVPGAYALWPNYPNPFNPQTRITFELPVASDVRLTVYDVLGREVVRLASGSYPAGTHAVTWDGRDAAGAMVPSGVYLYRLEAGPFSQTRRMTLLK